MWAAAASQRTHLLQGFENAHSWAVDAHKWLNVPYDSGLIFVRNPQHLRAAMAVSAAYLSQPEGRQPDEYVPEMSRRARGVEVWAALKSLGREGVADLIERCCRFAAFFAHGLQAAGYEILNEVTLNQVLVSFGCDELTRRVITAIQSDGTCWCGGTIFMVGQPCASAYPPGQPRKPIVSAAWKPCCELRPRKRHMRIRKTSKKMRYSQKLAGLMVRSKGPA